MRRKQKAEGKAHRGNQILEVSSSPQPKSVRPKLSKANFKFKKFNPFIKYQSPKYPKENLKSFRRKEVKAAESIEKNIFHYLDPMDEYPWAFPEYRGFHEIKVGKTKRFISKLSFRNNESAIFEAIGSIDAGLV